MKSILFFFAIFHSVCCISNPQYFLFPDGVTTVSQTVNVKYGIRHPIGPWKLSNFAFKNAQLYDASGTCFGTIEKQETTRSYAFKLSDEVQSVHYACFLCRGLFFDSLKSFEVHDSTGNIIGHIDGIFHTNTSAEFHFFDDADELFAKALLNESYSELVINSSTEQALIVCRKIFSFTPAYSANSCKFTYYWKVNIVSEPSLDSAFLWPFLGFIGDVWWNNPT